ncbi:MAG: phosphatase [Firmicutes bacterium]|nr:phosphatase [Bacillota bacterium]
MKYILDVHCHTVSSGHAYSTLTENINYAASVGMKLIATTDHAPAMRGAPSNLHFFNFAAVPPVINGVEHLSGVELNILDYDGRLDLKSGEIKRVKVVIASLHPICIEPADIVSNTSALVCAMENPLVKIIGHPGDPRYPIDIKKVVDTAVRTNTVLEVNNASLDPNSTRKGGESIIIDIIKECKKRSYPIILGSDAHYHTAIGDFSRAEKLLKEADFPDELVLNTSVEFFKSTLDI